MSTFKKGDNVFVVSKSPMSFDWHDEMDRYLNNGVAYPVVSVRTCKIADQPLYEVTFDDATYLFYASSLASAPAITSPAGRMKFLPFDLEAARAGAQIATRTGHAAKFIAFEQIAIFPLVVMTGPNSIIYTYRKDGTLAGDNRDDDLVMAVPVEIRYVNLFAVSAEAIHGAAEHYATEADATKEASAWIAKGGTPLIAVASPIEVRAR